MNEYYCIELMWLLFAGRSIAGAMAGRTISKMGGQ